MDWNIKENKWDFLTKFMGKTLGIIGPDNCGKSVLYELILTRELKEVEGGSTNTRAQSRILRISFKDNKALQKDVMIKMIDDVGGQRNLFQLKKETFESQKYIIYVFRSDLIMPMTKQIKIKNIDQYRNTHSAAIIQDFKNMNTWKKGDKNLIIVGNHFGYLQDGKNLIIPYEGSLEECFVPNFHDLQIKREYKREFKRIVENGIQLSFNNFKSVDYVVGSLISNTLGNQLVLDLLNSLV